MPQWRNSWISEPVKLRTEIPDFMGKVGKTVVIERHLVSTSSIEMTVHVYEKDAIVVGPCRTWMKRTSDVGPQPIAWLRSRGNSLKLAAERIEALEKLAKMIEENVDELSAAHDADRVFPSRFNGVAQMLLHGIRSYQSLVEPWMTPGVLEDGCPPALVAGVQAEYTVINEPKGVCINISPWNAPVQLSLMPVMAMLASGNHGVIKPPDLVPTVSALLRRLVQKYLHGYVWVEEGGKDAVERLIDESADHLIFTGGSEVAKSIAARCAQHLTPITLELGGKSPVFIDSSLSEELLDAAVREILETKVFKTGQFCCAHDYALVHENIHDKFCAKLATALDALGDKRNVHVIGRRQYEELKQKFEALPDIVKCVPPMSGKCTFKTEAMSIPMTGLLHTPQDSDLLKFEIFGPFLPIVKVKDVDEAIKFVNDVPTGKPLIAYCYSESEACADSFMAGTSSGNLAINSGPQRLIANVNVGFGGVGASGFGVSMWGREAMREYTNRRHVVRARSGFAKSFFSGPPPSNM
jgi:acyl-CoA reductase-like NAD-dependent aldehyde dehydrogenase